MKIFLDDIRKEPLGFVRTYTVESTKHLIRACIVKGECVEILSLDNDLGEGIEEGYKVLDWLEELHFENPEFPLPHEVRVHSANPVARKRMQQVINKLYR